ncbi:hypothetical protein F2Q69_00048084 [Brassica cretica]|uniref:Uncharacterized protein n=1 Tax=Brassica cretica TaxID=69181 RepID=A0A8S9PM84_BRACR|nr:hypothetical protein F2Q69_00048084 [Brassica cretica]
MKMSFFKGPKLEKPKKIVSGLPCHGPVTDQVQAFQNRRSPYYNTLPTATNLEVLCRSDRHFKLLWDLISEVAAQEEEGVGNP